MRKALAALIAAGALVVAVAPFARAALHEVTVANYYFEDDATGARSLITVNKGDQIRFTIRQAAYPPHSIVVDEYGIDSGQLLIFETYTTPPLNKPGTFVLYCRAHEMRGHKTKLVVKAPPSPSPSGSTTPKEKPTPGATASATVKPAATVPAKPDASVAPTAGASQEPLAQVGAGVATDRRRAKADPNSLAGVLGRSFGGDAPWTSAFWLSAIVALGIAGAAGLAISRELRRGPPP